LTVNTLLKSDVFDAWLVALQDRRGKARIITSIRRAELGNFGDTKPVGEGVHEMRVHSGPGYRVYYTRRGARLYWLLLGGDKSSQARDIARAIEMAKHLPEDP
jgi:putative addiction module killer protein